MQNPTYNYIDRCISTYMGSDPNYMGTLNLNPENKYNAFITFIKTHTQRIYEKSHLYNLNLLDLQFETFQNIDSYLVNNYSNYNPSNTFTINIIAFQKKLIYYLIYIVSILCNHSETDNIIINLCCDIETYQAHTQELEIIKAFLNGYHFESGNDFSVLLNNNGPLITLIDELMKVSKNLELNRDLDKHEYVNFFYQIISYLRKPNIKINYIIINDSLAKGIGMKRGIINYHNYCVGKRLGNTEFSSLVLDDNITHIIKPIYGKTKTTQKFDEPLYLSEDSEMSIPCGTNLALGDRTPKSAFQDNKVRNFIYGPSASNSETQYLDAGTGTLQIVPVPEQNINSISNREIGLTHKLTLDESGYDKKHNILASDASSLKYRLVKYKLGESNIDIFKEGILSGKSETAKTKLCTWKSNALAKVTKGTYDDDFSKCINRYSILQMYKKLLRKMSTDPKYLVGGIAKGMLGMDDVPDAICTANATAVYKLTLQKQYRLWGENCVYNIFSSRYWEDIPFNSLVAQKNIPRSESRILKMYYGLRFGHFDITDNEDLLSTYLNDRLYPITNVLAAKTFLKQIILHEAIKGIKESHIITAYYQQILINLYGENALKYFEFPRPTIAAAGKYVIFHNNTWNLIDWFNGKPYLEESSVNFMNIDFDKMRSIGQIHNYNNYCCINTDFSFIETIGGSSVALRLTLLPDNYDPAQVQENQELVKQVKNALAQRQEEARVQAHLQAQTEVQMSKENIKLHLDEYLKVREMYAEQAKQLVDTMQQYENKIQELQSVFAETESTITTLNTNKIQYEELLVQLQNTPCENQAKCTEVQNYFTARHEEYQKILTEIEQKKAQRNSIAKEGTEYWQEYNSLKLQEVTYNEEYRKTNDLYTQLQENYATYESDIKAYYGFKKYKKYKTKYLKLKVKN